MLVDTTYILGLHQSRAQRLGEKACGLSFTLGVCLETGEVEAMEIAGNGPARKDGVMPGPGPFRRPGDAMGAKAAANHPDLRLPCGGYRIW